MIEVHVSLDEWDARSMIEAVLKEVGANARTREIYMDLYGLEKEHLNDPQRLSGIRRAMDRIRALYPDAFTAPDGGE